MDIRFRAWYEKDNEVHEVDKIDFKNGEIYFDNGQIAFFNEVKLLKYTGLKDRKGQCIYEGDIIGINEEESSIKLPVKFGKYEFSKFIGDCGEISDTNKQYGFYVENEYLHIAMLNGKVIILGSMFPKLSWTLIQVQLYNYSLAASKEISFTIFSKSMFKLIATLHKDFIMRKYIEEDIIKYLLLRYYFNNLSYSKKV